MESSQEKKPKKNVINVLTDFLKKHNASLLTLGKKVHYIIEKRQTFSQTDIHKFQYFDCKLPWIPEDKLQAIQKDHIKMIQTSYKMLEDFSFRTNYEVGDQFESITDLYNVYENKDHSTLFRNEGQILMIHFWNTWYHNI